MNSAPPSFDNIPSHLQERARIVSQKESPKDSQYVLYWMNHAMRVEENPALDCAISVADQMKLPVLIFQQLTNDIPFSSDRHHTFVLQGMRDLQQQFKSQKIEYFVHVERKTQQEDVLSDLCKNAAFVVTEEMPLAFWRDQANQLASKINVSIACVDTACVVPMQTVGKAHTRAFEYRNATKDRYEKELLAEYPAIKPKFDSKELNLPFETINLKETNISELVAQCKIDHTIPPISKTPGGSTAGYKRWNDFKKNRLKRYDKDRNDALSDGVSRMSAYLHYGMVSPMRIAREAKAFGGSGAEKYLDELLIWRELAYAFCFYKNDVDSLIALPEWAQKTLLDHANDPRNQTYSWERLSRGETGDTLWDATQKSLLIHGELHNNVRMTWGKAILDWKDHPSKALETILDLNNRYALDGRDPASYGGILWCLGQFDRPFPPDKPIIGKLRERTTTIHAQRLNPETYMNQTSKSQFDPIPKIAVIGAGLSGLICARTLADQGCDVTVFERGRGAGGRMSTRTNEDGTRFDHGAQFFTARDERFQRYVESWQEEGVVAQWLGEICKIKNGNVEHFSEPRTRYVGTPNMNSICKHLSQDIDIKFNQTVSPVKKNDNLWVLENDKNDPLGEFDYVISSGAPLQAAAIFENYPSINSVAESVKMNPCWAVMLELNQTLDVDFQGAFVEGEVLSWIAKNSAKPERDSKNETWVLHADYPWSIEHLEDDPQSNMTAMIDNFTKLLGVDPKAIFTKKIHRWKFAAADNPLSEGCLFDADLKIGACGDWCQGNRVEGAFLSGAAMAGRILGHLGGIEKMKRV